jgi:hypothetical protein
MEWAPGSDPETITISGSTGLAGQHDPAGRASPARRVYLANGTSCQGAGSRESAGAAWQDNDLVFCRENSGSGGGILRC